MKYSAVLFDLDGTLLNTLEDIADSMNGVLKALGLPAHDREEYKYFVGNGVENLVRQALSTIHEPVVSQGITAWHEEYGKHWADKTRTYKGIPELLESLAGRDVKMAVLSNKPDEFTKLMVAKLLPYWRFHPVYGATPAMPKKPDPTLALEIANILEILPNQFVYLGDSDTDMKTATAAGMFPVGALWGFRTAEELKASGAKALIHNPMDLMELL